MKAKTVLSFAQALTNNEMIHCAQSKMKCLQVHSAKTFPGLEPLFSSDQSLLLIVTKICPTCVARKRVIQTFTPFINAKQANRSSFLTIKFSFHLDPIVKPFKTLGNETRLYYYYIVILRLFSDNCMFTWRRQMRLGLVSLCMEVY